MNTRPCGPKGGRSGGGVQVLPLSSVPPWPEMEQRKPVTVDSAFVKLCAAWERGLCVVLLSPPLLARMTPGKLARKILGRYSVPVGNAYRRIFVDLGVIAEHFDGFIPRHANVLDIGGGDGAPMQFLLDRRPDLSVTMCDLAPSIGGFLSAENRAKVTLFPATDLSQISGQFDCVTIADVIHHIPVEQRSGFFAKLAEGCQRWGCRKLLFKDVEPGSWRSVASLLSDWYITGDRHVVLFPRSEFAAMVDRYFPEAIRTSAMPDWPNYCEVVSW